MMMQRKKVVLSLAPFDEPGKLNGLACLSGRFSVAALGLGDGRRDLHLSSSVTGKPGLVARALVVAA